MSDHTFRSRVIRLAHARPELRRHLLPLLKQAKVTVVQRSKGGYSVELLTDLATRIAQSMGAASLKLRIEMLRKTRGVGAYFNSLNNGSHLIHIETLKWQTLKGIAETMAHEITHAMHQEAGRLKTTVVDEVLGDVWDGKFYPKSTPYNSRPWEIEAREAESKGVAIYQQMKAGGIDLRTEGEKLSAKILPDQGPTVGDLEDKSPEEVLEIWKRLRAKKP